jgi:hypothetical protein
MEAKTQQLKQLRNWVNGKSEHDYINNQCVPDFSCCSPELQQPKKTREAAANAFLTGDYETFNNFLMFFLGKFLEKESSKKYYIGPHTTQGN